MADHPHMHAGTGVQHGEPLTEEVSIEDFRRDPAAVIDRAFERGAVVVTGGEPHEGVRFSTQRYDIEPD